MNKTALITILLLLPAAAAAQQAQDCSPAADACVARPKTTDIFGLPLPAAEAAQGKKDVPATIPSAPVPEAAQDQAVPGEEMLPDLSFLEHASTALHLWLGLALAVLAAAEAFSADNPGRRTLSLAGCALAAALSLGSIAAAYAKLGPEARYLLDLRPGFLLYFGTALLTACAALAQLLSRHSGNGGGFWGGASAFFLAAAGAALLVVRTRVNPDAAALVMAGHVPVAAALLAAGAARGFLLFSAAAPARAALAVFLFIAAAMSGLYKESPDAFSLHFSTVTDSGAPEGGAEKAAAERTNEKAADKKGPRG